MNNDKLKFNDAWAINCSNPIVCKKYFNMIVAWFRNISSTFLHSDQIQSFLTRTGSIIFLSSHKTNESLTYA